MKIKMIRAWQLIFRLTHLHKLNWDRNKKKLKVRKQRRAIMIKILKGKRHVEEKLNFVFARQCQLAHWIKVYISQPPIVEDLKVHLRHKRVRSSGKLTTWRRAESAECLWSRIHNSAERTKLVCVVSFGRKVVRSTHTDSSLDLETLNSLV